MLFGQEIMIMKDAYFNLIKWVLMRSLGKKQKNVESWAEIHIFPQWMQSLDEYHAVIQIYTVPNAIVASGLGWNLNNILISKFLLSAWFTS